MTAAAEIKKAEVAVQSGACEELQKNMAKDQKDVDAQAKQIEIRKAQVEKEAIVTMELVQ